MLSQTTAQILPLLQLLEQPAFCIRQDSEVLSNPAARALVPASAGELTGWLGDGAAVYAAWNRQDSLSLPLTLPGGTCSVIIQALADGTLFLLSQCDSLLAGSTPLAAAAQVLRQPLSELYSLTQGLTERMEDMEDPVLQAQSCAINRQLYRLSRIACSLADLEHLESGTYQLRLEKLDLYQFLEPLIQELEDVCRSAGRCLKSTLPKKTVFITADAALLERAILQLLSNALKYGRADTPIRFRVILTSAELQLQMCSICRDENLDFLAAAWNRQKQRGALPDPQWGIGLGLPMVTAISKLMGGKVAASLIGKNEAVITMTISRKAASTETTVSTPPPFDYTGGMLHSLVELSDVLPDACFHSAAL